MGAPVKPTQLLRREGRAIPHEMVDSVRCRSAQGTLIVWHFANATEAWAPGAQVQEGLLPEGLAPTVLDETRAIPPQVNAQAAERC